MSLRLFVGIPLSAEVAATLLKSCESLKASDAGWRGAKWVSVENLHVTVAFLGVVGESLVPAITECLSAVITPSPSIRLSLRDIEAVPNRAKCRMIWATFVDEGNLAGQLSDTIRNGMRQLSIEVDDKPFRAHVTLCRARGPQPVSLAALAAAKTVLPSEPRPMSDPAVTLFASRLTPRGPLYSEIATWVSLGE